VYNRVVVLMLLWSQSYLHKNDSGQEKVINTLLPSSAECELKN